MGRGRFSGMSEYVMHLCWWYESGTCLSDCAFIWLFYWYSEKSKSNPSSALRRAPRKRGWGRVGSKCRVTGHRDLSV